MESILRKEDIARKIAKKYRGISICDAQVFIDIMLEAVLDSIIHERQTVELYRLGKFGLKIAPKNGRDFKTGKQIRGSDRVKVVFKASNYLKEQAKILSADIPDFIAKREE